MGLDHEEKQFIKDLPKAKVVARKAGEEAEPVPPAGGEVEVLGYSVKGNRYAIRLTKAELLELYEGYTGDALVELVDRRHVTRLQSENAALQQRLNVADQRNDEMQSDLTKSRELLKRAMDSLFHGASDSITASEIHAFFMGHQSAPAANFIACKVDESCGQDAEAAKGEKS